MQISLELYQIISRNKLRDLKSCQRIGMEFIISWRSLSRYSNRDFSQYQIGSCYSIFSLMCMLCRSLFVLLSYFFYSLCFLFFFDLRIMITRLVSSTLLNVKLELIECLFPHKCTSQYTSKLQWSNTFLVKILFVLIYVVWHKLPQLYTKVTEP